jgi:hypothetical protein
MPADLDSIISGVADRWKNILGPDPGTNVNYKMLQPGGDLPGLVNDLGGANLSQVGYNPIGSWGGGPTGANLGAGWAFDSNAGININNYRSFYAPRQPDPNGPGTKAAQIRQNSARASGYGDMTAYGDPNGETRLPTDKWDDLMRRVSGESGVPFEVLKSIMGIESGGRDEIVGYTNSSGATGLMQVVGKYWQGTANKYGGSLTDPYTNVRTAADILLGYKNQYGGTWDRAAGAYLAGDPDSAEVDANGTSTNTYMRLFRNNMAALGWGPEADNPYDQGAGGGGGQGTSGRIFPVEGYKGGLSLHWGEDPGAIDIFAPQGTPVRAMVSGNAQSGYSDIGGYWVHITGDDGYQYYYAHLDRPANVSGRVNAGAYLGGVGDTGNAKGTGAHLHLGIGTTIYSGTGPRGGAGDADVIAILKGSQGYGYG